MSNASNANTKNNAANANLALWDSAQTTDPKYTKDFTRRGGFSGTAICPTYLALKATEAFGPMGIGWGVDILEEKYVNGAPLGFDSNGCSLGTEIIHVLRVELWYMRGDKRGSIKHFGQTTFVGAGNNRVYTDEEAPKKSLTDGMAKCLSLLGFGGDVHLGLFDDQKYVNDLRAQFGEANTTLPQSKPAPQVPTTDTAKVPPGPVSPRYLSYKRQIDDGRLVGSEQLHATINADKELNDVEKKFLISATPIQKNEDQPKSSDQLL